MKALLITDIQYDFLPGGALAVPEGDKIIPLVNTVMEHFPLVVALQDWHPSTHKSFASNHKGKEPMDVIDLDGIEQILWPDHCVQGTQGAQYSSEINSRPIEAIIRKGMDPEIDSYSGFYDNGHKKNTGLAGYLQNRKVTEIYIVGLAGDFCVYFTAMDAIKEGFTTHIISDAVRSIDSDNFEQCLKKFHAEGGKTVTSEDLSGSFVNIVEYTDI